MGLFSIQRLFVSDTLSFESGINSTKAIRSDSVENLLTYILYILNTPQLTK